MIVQDHKLLIRELVTMFRIRPTSKLFHQYRAISSKGFQTFIPKHLLVQQIRMNESCVLSNESFTRLATECGVSNVPETRAALREAGCLVDFETHVHVKPAMFLAQSCGEWTTTSAVEEQLRESQICLNRMSEPLRPHAEKIKRKRKLIWAFALFFSGLQLAVISRLTYFDLDWDIMEPVSYFLGTFTSLVFFVYLLRFRREHSYQDFDKTFFTGKLRATVKDFDWKTYNKSLQNVRCLQEKLMQRKEWMRRN